MVANRANIKYILLKNVSNNAAFLQCTLHKKCDQIPRKLWIWSHLLKKSLMENFIFYAVVRDQDAVWNFEFYLILRLNNFPQSLTKMAEHYCLAENTSWNHINFKTYLLFNIRQILQKAKFPQATQVLFFIWKERLIHPTFSSFWFKFLMKSSI